MTTGHRDRRAQSTAQATAFSGVSQEAQGSVHKVRATALQILRRKKAHGANAQTSEMSPQITEDREHLVPGRTGRPHLSQAIREDVVSTRTKGHHSLL